MRAGDRRSFLLEANEILLHSLLLSALLTTIVFTSRNILFAFLVVRQHIKAAMAHAPQKNSFFTPAVEVILEMTNLRWRRRIVVLLVLVVWLFKIAKGPGFICGLSWSSFKRQGTGGAFIRHTVVFFLDPAISNTRLWNTTTIVLRRN
jgi:hypothetical protein